MRTSRIILCLALLVMVAGCKSSFNTAPVLDINEHNIIQDISAANVEKCIKNAGDRLGWQMVTVSPGVIEATLYNRQHTAVVTIPFSRTKYSILYKSSINLYAEGGTIHKSYNRWVRNLEKEIGIELSRVSR